MPAKKRKASSNSGAPSKKVRIGGTTNIPDQPAISPAGRPKRTSVSEPQYNFTRRRLSTTQNAPTEEPEPAVKRRGRPPKTASAPPAPKVEVTPKKGRSGRTPKKATTSISKPTSISTKKPVIKSSTPTTARRGRLPKALSQIDQALPESESESNDPLALNGGAATVVNAGGSKVEDLTGVDNDIQYWLMKAEPDSRIECGVDVKFSIDDLAAKTEPEAWDGVRNAMARNNMRAMRKGDLAFFYHSNCNVPGIAGVMRIVAEHSIDESAFDPEHPYFDAKSDRAKPKWEVVHVEFVKKFENFISLRELKTFSKPSGALANMQMLKLTRLSVSSVSPEEWRFILDTAGEPVSLGHGDGMGGYESEVDGEGEETAGVSDADGVNGFSDGGVGLGITGAAIDTEVLVVNRANDSVESIDSEKLDGAEEA